MVRAKKEKAKEEAKVMEEIVMEEASAVESLETELLEDEVVTEEATVKDWQQEKEELLDTIKRKQADIDNLRRISKLEQAEAREYALHQFLNRLLPVLDNLERGLEAARSADNIPEAYVEGLEMIKKQLMQTLEQEGVSTIEAVGCQFDPNCHHAVMQEESADSDPGTVLEELQKGYRHHKRVLRPAMVKVCQE